MPLIDPELLPFVDEVRAANAETTARMVESSAAFDPKGDFIAQLRSMMEAGGVFGQPLVDEAEERTIPGPAGDDSSPASFRPPSMRCTSPSTAARS